MEFRSVDESDQVRTLEIASDSGDTLQFDLSEFFQGRRLTKQTLQEIFHFNNLFFSRLESNRRAEIYALYEDIEDRLRNQMDTYRLHLELTKKVRRLFELIPFDEVRQFMRTQTIHYSQEKIKPSYEETNISKRFSADNNFERRTYVRDDYLELVYLCVYLRFLTPIWGQYLRRISHDHQKESYRKYIALRLIANTPVYDSEPMQKLTVHIEDQLATKEKEYLRSKKGRAYPRGAEDIAALGGRYTAYVVSGLSSSEIPNWLLASVIMKRLLFEVLSDPGQNLIDKIHRQIDTGIGTTPPSSFPSIRGKGDSFGGGDDEDEGEKSYAEVFKVKEDHPVADYLAYAIFVDEPMRLLTRLRAGQQNVRVDQNYLNHLVQQAHRGESIQFEKVQLTLLKWVVGTIIPPPIIDKLKVHSLLNTIAVAQALLLDWGYPDFAAIILSQSTRMPIEAHLTKHQVTKMHFAQFTTYYPAYPRGDGRVEQQRRQNFAWLGVEAVADQLTLWEWIPWVDDDILSQCRHVHQVDGPVIAFGGDYKSQLCDLALDILDQQERISQQRRDYFVRL